MLARYKMYRGSRPPLDPLPDGERRDTRHFRGHVLRPEREAVEAYLVAPGEQAWRTFRKAYLALLERRFREDRTEFDALARRAQDQDVFLGCSCPTTKNPRVDRCHTWLALEFMKSKYPDVRVEFPPLPKP